MKKTLNENHEVILLTNSFLTLKELLSYCGLLEKVAAHVKAIREEKLSRHSKEKLPRLVRAIGNLCLSLTMLEKWKLSSKEKLITEYVVAANCSLLR